MEADASVGAGVRLTARSGLATGIGLAAGTGTGPAVPAGEDRA